MIDENLQGKSLLKLESVGYLQCTAILRKLGRLQQSVTQADSY